MRKIRILAVSRKWPCFGLGLHFCGKFFLASFFSVFNGLGHEKFTKSLHFVYRCLVLKKQVLFSHFLPLASVLSFQQRKERTKESAALCPKCSAWPKGFALRCHAKFFSGWVGACFSAYGWAIIKLHLSR
jgi:hypothetical protein